MSRRRKFWGENQLIKKDGKGLIICLGKQLPQSLSWRNKVFESLFEISAWLYSV